MSEKRRTLDLEEVQAALDRAAWNAVHGPPEVRAGRFVRRGARDSADGARAATECKPDAARGKK